jgi:dipeptidyl aminopeptidase/acylaminoacyl peptidase
MLLQDPFWASGRRIMLRLGLIGLACACLVSTGVRAAADSRTPAFDAASAFGARPGVSDMRLSPDGKSVSYLVPLKGQGSALMTRRIDDSTKPHVALVATGDPDRLAWCNWVASSRLVCEVYGLGPKPDLLPYARLVAIDADGGNMKVLNKPKSAYARDVEFVESDIIDWLPDEDGAVLMSRSTIANDHLGSLIGSDRSGLGVDWIDTRTLASRPVVAPNERAVRYISDGRGNVRIMEVRLVAGATGMDSGVRSFLYRPRGSDSWKPLCQYNDPAHEGFLPLAVDHDLDVAYGYAVEDGRRALYTLALDGTGARKLVYANDQVDVGWLLRIGRRRRVVGVDFVTDKRYPVYTDAAVGALWTALGRAVQGSSLSIVDSSVDEGKLLLFAASDRDAGVYHLFDRASHKLDTYLVARAELEGVQLAKVRPLSYPAGDGTPIPGYLTLPPGVESAKGLPAIVLPHGGPAARDEWGFDWLPQFFAARGYAVLQPNFRGSDGYGERWFQRNGFRSWPTAIGDVVDGGRWLVAEGIADPSRLAVVGWSYGGYAALQSAVVAPDVFKAVVAVAAVTDLAELKEQSRNWSNFRLIRDYIGEGPHVREGSPARNAERIKVPVLLFHGSEDRNVFERQSTLMDSALKRAGVPHELVIYPGLDHQLEDSAARADLLRRSDAFLRAAFDGH